MPSPVSATAKPHNLPRQLTPFVGRQTEVTQISAQLAEPGCCLLTLVGPGGIGKTRLALAAAQQLIDLGAQENPKFNDGIFFQLATAWRRRFSGFRSL